MVTWVPTGPPDGVNELISGAVDALVVTVKLVELVAVPDAVVVVTGPLAAPAGTVATTWVSELTV